MLFLLGILVFLYSVVSALGFIFLPTFGEIYASFGLSFIIIFTFVFGDRLLLGAMRAKLHTGQDKLNYEISNIALKFSIPRINLYVSDRVSGWHILDNSFASPSLIINPLTLERLNDEELRALFSLACFKVKSGLARRVNIFLVLFVVILYPLALCKPLEKIGLRYISVLIKSLLFPFVILKGVVINQDLIQSRLVENFLSKYDLEHELTGAMFKVNQSSISSGNDFLSICIETISLTDQDSKEKLSYYIRTI